MIIIMNKYLQFFKIWLQVWVEYGVKTKLVFLYYLYLSYFVGFVYSSTLIIWALITNHGFFPNFLN
jgi:hypothetical protein